MKVWLDDERPMPDFFSHHAKTAEEAIELLKSGQVLVISLDHDLGQDKTGYDVAKFIEQAAFEGTLQQLKLMIHTANPAGRKQMAMALQNAQRYWQKQNLA